MKNIKAKLLLVILTCCLVACNDDSEEVGTEVLIDIDDVEVLTDALVIANSNLIEGDAPSPTIAADAPELYADDNEEYGAIAGRSFYLNPQLMSGEIAGAYLQIEGSSKYFDIPLNSATSTGRFGKVNNFSKLFKNARSSESETIEIEIPTRLEPGSFCAIYCVYDSEGRVSNLVEICIEIINFGGDGSEFLVENEWDLKSINYGDGQNQFTQIPGELLEYEDEVSLICEDNNYMTVTVIESERIDEFVLSFGNEGTYSFFQEVYSKSLDWENSNCEQVAYNEETYEVTETGGWTFDQSRDILTVVTEHNFDGEIFTEIFTVTAKMEGENLVITQEDDLFGTYELVLKRK